jgi:hypothetical protein
MLQHLQEREQQAATQEQAGMQWLAGRLHVYRKEQVQALEGFLQNFDEDALKKQIEGSIVKGGSSNGKGQTH